MRKEYNTTNKKRQTTCKEYFRSSRMDQKLVKNICVLNDEYYYYFRFLAYFGITILNTLKKSRIIKRII